MSYVVTMNQSEEPGEVLLTTMSGEPLPNTLNANGIEDVISQSVEHICQHLKGSFQPTRLAQNFRPYTKLEFEQWYGEEKGQTRWEAAIPVKSVHIKLLDPQGSMLAEASL